MILKSQVEWALHCCAVLAGVPEGRYLSTRALAEFHGVPKEYLSKALQSLSNAGIVTGTLGPSGGYRLAKRPDELTFLEIVEAVEGKGRSFQCSEIRQNSPCAQKGACYDHPCAIAKIMWQADEAWRASLAGVRLSDLLTTLASDLPEGLRRDTAAWIDQRAG